MYKKECKWCAKLITTEKQQGFASHVAVCGMNPNKKGNKNKGKLLVERFTLSKECSKCGNTFEVITTEALINRGKVKNYCSPKCSNSNKKTEEQKKKISETCKKSDKVKNANKKIGIEKRGKRNENDYTFTCLYCNKIGQDSKWNKNRKYHTDCWKKASGGIRQGSSRGKSGWYKGYWCDSSYELAYLIYHLDKGLEIIRNKEGFEYTFHGEKHLFYPDFIISELKFFISIYFPSINAKLNFFPHKIDIYYKNTITPYLEYAIKNYGKDFIKLYEIKQINIK